MTTPDPATEPEPTYTRLELVDMVRIAAEHLRMVEEEHYRAYLDRRAGRDNPRPGVATDKHLESLRGYLKSLQERHSQS